MKFYVVKKGRVPGVYRKWDDAKKQIDGYSNAEYKSFNNVADAAEYMDWSEEEKKDAFKPAEDTLQNAINKIKSASKNVKPSKKMMKKPNTKLRKKKQLSMFEEKSDDYYAVIYTDGGSRNTGASKKGGKVAPTDKAAWAYLIEKDGEKLADGSGGRLGATNNEMEIKALIEAMKKLIELDYNEEKLLFCLDSQYVINGATQWMQSWKKRGWKRSSGKLLNKELWQELDSLKAKFPNLEFKWVKGHAGQHGNEYVDSLLNDYMDNHE